jgi:hypothetical protein
LPSLPISPKLFLCLKCNVYFFSYSLLEKPTHSKCTGHNTRLATKQEIDAINKTNGTHFIYNEEIKNLNER